MSSWLKVVAYALLTLFLTFVLRELGFKGSRLVALVGTVTLLGVCIIYIGELIDKLPSLSAEGEEYAVAMLKVVGVGYVFGICSDICREMDQTSLGSAVCLFGKAEILMICYPFVERIIERGLSLI